MRVLGLLGLWLGLCMTDPSTLCVVNLTCIETTHTIIKGHFLGARIAYYNNSTATFQLRLLISGDVNPNPGPNNYRFDEHPNDTPNYEILSDNQTHQLITYSRDALLNIQHNPSRLPFKVWSTIKSLGLNSKKPTRRGTASGRKRHRYDLVDTNKPVPGLIRSRVNKTDQFDRSSRPGNLVTPQINKEPLMNMRLWNSRSIRNKTTTCNDYVIEHDVDAIFLVETWMSSSDPVVIGELKPNGYSFLHFPRGIDDHGGIGVLSKSQLGFRLHPLGITTITFEHASVLDPNNGVHYVAIYRPPPSKENKFTWTGFLEEFEEFLHKVSLLQGKLIMLGDFNVHVNKPDRSDVSTFMTLLSSFGLKQHITQPTHKKGNTLDLIITRFDENLVRLCDVGTRYGSDHHMITFILQLRKPPPLRVESTIRDFRKIDHIALKHDLDLRLNANITAEHDSMTADEILDHFNQVSVEVLNIHAPSSTRKRLVRPRPLWYTDEIRAEKQVKHRLERKWRKSKLQVDKDAYWAQHLRYIKLLDASKKKHYNDKLSGAGAKETFKIIGVLLNQTDKILPTLYKPDVLGNKFANFFNEKVEKIRTSITCNMDNNNDDNMYMDVVVENVMYKFRELDQSEVCSIVKDSANKSCKLDSLPTWLLKENIDVVLPTLTSIVNRSLTNGIFPNDLKQAIVTPVLKKVTLDWNDLKNYRPVSNISFIGKIIEKAAIVQVNEHLKANDLDELYQSAYKNKHSTETALLKVKDDIAQALDHDKAAFLIMLDLSAAFDTIDHGILLHRLDHGFGIKGTALKWFHSYITGRQFCVSVGGVMSDKFDLSCGVPQGSIIGPRVFTMYAQYVACIIKRHKLNYHIYADDVQIYMFFNPKVPGDAACTIFKLLSCVNELRTWLLNNMLKLNDSKTEFFISASPHNMARLSNITFQIGSSEIFPSPSIKNLGVTFDTALTMSEHVTSLCKSINFLLWNLARIRRFIDHGAASNAMRALVLSKLDYANALLSGCRSKDIARLQRLQNRAARIVFQVPRRSSTTPLLKSLHWLPIKKRIQFKTLLYIFKALNGLSPDYLCDCITIYVPQRKDLRSNMDKNRLVIPRSNKWIGDGSFGVSGPTFWNQLPQHIRLSPTVDAFKRNLKTHLFL